MQRTISIIGIKMDLGSYNRGADQGPKAIRQSGLLQELLDSGFNLVDLGDLSIKISEQLNCNALTTLDMNDAEIDFQSIAKNLKKIVTMDHFPLILGGDHSISIGTIAGVSPFYQNLGVIWFDAHADVNTPDTSPTGSIYGMPLAVNLGYGHPFFLKIGDCVPKIKPENVVLIGTREIDPGEIDFLNEHQIKIYSANDIRQMGIQRVTTEALNYLGQKCDGIHLSFDLDALHPSAAPGVRTPSDFGVSLSDSISSIELMGRAKRISSLEFVEVNPNLDIEDRTSKVAVTLIKTFFVNYFYS
ncbi:MAG: arginase [Bacillota bacterium]